MRPGLRQGVLRGLVFGLPALVVAWAAVAAAGTGDQRSAEDTVRELFAARRAGDCPRLGGLLTEASWSAGGRLDREAFLEECDRVVGVYHPALAGVEVVSEDGREAVVQVAVAAGPSRHEEGLRVASDVEGEHAYGRGRLVREGGDWRVEADDGFLRVGRSAEQTVRGYVDAYNARDCERLADHLSERLVAEEDCGAATERRQALPAEWARLREPTAIDVASDRSEPPDPATAVARWSVPTLDGTLTSSAQLVRDGLEWRVDRVPEAVEHIELAGRLLLDAPLPGFGLDVVRGVSLATGSWMFVEVEEGGDIAERRAAAGFRWGAMARLRVADDGDTHANLVLVLYEFAAADGARAHADLLAGRVGEGADRRSPAPVPSVADARGAVVRCGGGEDDCPVARAAAAVAVDGRFLVAVELVDDRDVPADRLVAQVEEVLRAQLARL